MSWTEEGLGLSASSAIEFALLGVVDRVHPVTDATAIGVDVGVRR